MKLAVVATAVAAGIAVGATASQASTPTKTVFAANRAPTVTGEIYRLDPNGRRVDLSKSPAGDASPAVSSDGTRVAFVSGRGGGSGVYEVGINGRGLVAVARRVPSLDQSNGLARLAWQPHGALLAADTGHAVSLLQPGYKPVNLRNARFGVPQPWSPDGQVLLLFRGSDTVRAVSPQGLTLWTHAADSAGAWSSQGLVAVSAGRGVAVYDEVGGLRFALHLPTTPGAIAWSRDGSRLAVEWTIDHSSVEVTSDTGRRLLQKRVTTGDLGWNGDRRLVIGNAACPTCTATGINVATGKTSTASSRWLEPRSADGKLAIFTQADAPGFDLGASPLPRGPERTYHTVPGCDSYGALTPAVSFPQFAGSSIVYQSWGDCDPPFDNLYAATGTRVHRLTNAQAEETQPALSPDGSEIAYVWASARGISCSGCSDGIRIATATGESVRTLTGPDSCTFDDSPTWSPDGQTILYSESTCDTPGELFTIPAAGGTPHDLGVAGNEPAWGPTLIAYTGSDQSDPGLWTANPDGSDPVKVSSTGRSPAWSSDGRLAYLAGVTLHVQGQAPAKLPFKHVGSLAWTPDGTRLAVSASTTKTGPLDLYTVKPDGTGLVRLTKNYGVR